MSQGKLMSKSWKKRFDVKPVSANKMYYRAKQLTKEYREFREAVYDCFPNPPKFPFDDKEPLAIIIKCGLSSRLADLDNICKPAIDTMQLLLGFNDKRIFHMDVAKEIVKKGEEYLYIEIKGYKL